MRSAASILLLIFFVPITVILLVVTSLKLNVVTAEFIKHELAARKGYSIAISQIDKQIDGIKIDPQFPVTNAELKTIAHKVVPESWLQSNVESVLDKVFVWFNAQTSAQLSVTIDLHQPKQALQTQVNTLLAEKIPQIQPCTRQQRQSKDGQGICQFAGLTVDQVKTELAHQGFDVDHVANSLPDQLDLLHPDLSKLTGKDASTDDANQKAQDIQKNLDQAKAKYKQFHTYFLLAWLAYGVLFVAYVCANAWAGRRRMVRWLGIFGITVMALPLAISAASQMIFEKHILPNIHFDGNVPAGLPAAVTGAMSDARAALFNPILILSATVFVLGVAAAIGAHWLSGKKKS